MHQESGLMKENQIGKNEESGLSFYSKKSTIKILLHHCAYLTILINFHC